MGYIDQNILPDEKVLYRTKKHYIVFLTPVLWTAAALLFFLNHSIYINKAGFVFAAIALVFWIGTLLNYSVSEYAVTDKRILMREGFFVRHINDTRLTTTSNIAVDQNILGQILNYGFIVVKTYGGNDDPFTDIPRPSEFKRALEMQLDKMVK